jgi:FIMAH domain
MRIAIQPTSLWGQVQLIVGQVETLSDKGRLLAGEFGSLISHLETALSALLRENAAGARRALEAFVQHVQAMQSHDALTEPEAGALITAANGIISQL